MKTRHLFEMSKNEFAVFKAIQASQGIYYDNNTSGLGLSVIFLTIVGLLIWGNLS